MEKHTGITRRVDNLGRLVLPMELRRTLGIDTMDPVDISLDGERIILCKHHVSCVFCGQDEELANFQGKILCKACFRQIQAMPSPEAVEG